MCSLVLMCGTLPHVSLLSSWRLDQFSHFAALTGCQADRYTHRPRYVAASVALVRIVCYACDVS